jgi:hypothetical protein
MSKLLCFILISALFACNQNKQTGRDEASIDSLTKKDTKAPVTTTNSIDADALAKMAPFTEQEMRDLLPRQLMGAPIGDEDVNGSIGTLSAIGEYQVNDTTRLELLIVDCAGPGGSGVYSSQYLSMLGIDEEDEDEYTRTIDFRGGKAFENCYKNKIDCSLTWFEGRYLISLDGNMSSADLKKAAAELKF